MLSSHRCAQLGLVAAGALFASCLGVLYAHNPRQPIVVAAAATAGQPSPAFHLKSVDGQSYDSHALLGRAVVVFFSSTRCTTCDAYQPRVRDLARQYQHDPRVQFLAMNQDLSAGDHQRLLEVRVSVKMTGSPFPTLLDVDARTAAHFGAKPAQFAVLDARGVVRYLGAFDDNVDGSDVTRPYVAEELRRVLDELPTSVASR